MTFSYTPKHRRTKTNISESSSSSSRPNRSLSSTAKCVFRTAEVTFLGYRVSGESSRQLEEPAADLEACPAPKTVRQLRRFLRLLNFYRRFLPHAATTQAPIHDVLAGPRVKGRTLSLGHRCSVQPSTSARRVCNAQPLWHTQTPHQHSP